jgi:hypothetical protein
VVPHYARHDGGRVLLGGAPSEIGPDLATFALDGMAMETVLFLKDLCAAVRITLCKREYGSE